MGRLFKPLNSGGIAELCSNAPNWREGVVFGSNYLHQAKGHKLTGSMVPMSWRAVDRESRRLRSRLDTGRECD